MTLSLTEFKKIEPGRGVESWTALTIQFSAAPNSDCVSEFIPEYSC